MQTHEMKSIGLQPQTTQQAALYLLGNELASACHFFSS